MWPYTGLVWWFLLLFTLSQIGNSKQAHQTHKHVNNSKEFDQFWSSIDQVIRDTNNNFDLFADRIAQISADLNQSSSVCYRVVEKAFRSGLNQEWSAKLINSNSFAKSSFVSSLISEQYSSLGDFDDCLSVQHVMLNDANETFLLNGQYCLASLETPRVKHNQHKNITAYFDHLIKEWLTVGNRFPFVHAICAPSQCTAEELHQLFSQYFNKYLNGIAVHVGHCQQRDEQHKSQFTFGYIFAVIILSIFVFTSIICTCMSIIWTKQDWSEKHTLVVDIAKCFDIQQNFKLLFLVNSFEHNLRFIYGLKAWMIFLIVLVHSFCFVSYLLLAKISLFTKFSSFYVHIQTQTGIFYNFIQRSFLIIDFFFIISGFLTSHIVIQKFRKIPNFAFYLLARWFRFVPSVAAILCLTIALQKFGSGPLFTKELTDPYVKPCYDYWWSHVLFINNFWTIDQMCGPNLWFVSADFQLYILLYFVLYLYFRKQIAAYISSLVLMATSICILALLVALDIVGIPRGDYLMRFNLPAPLNAIRVFYTSPLSHICSYLLGAFIAFRLVKTKSRKSIPSQYEDGLFVLFAFLVALCILCPLPSSLLSEDNENTNFVQFLVFTMIYFVLICTSMAFLYLIILANKNSFFKQLLSARFTLPLGRLSFAIYLVNPLIIWWNVQQSRQTQQLTLLYTFQFFCVVYLQSIVLAIFLFIFFESPFHNLSRLLMKNATGRKKNRAQSKNQVNG